MIVFFTIFIRFLWLSIRNTSSNNASSDHRKKRIQFFNKIYWTEEINLLFFFFRFSISKVRMTNIAHWTIQSIDKLLYLLRSIYRTTLTVRSINCTWNKRDFFFSLLFFNCEWRIACNISIWIFPGKHAYGRFHMRKNGSIFPCGEKGNSLLFVIALPFLYILLFFLQF